MSALFSLLLGLFGVMGLAGASSKSDEPDPDPSIDEPKAPQPVVVVENDNEPETVEVETPKPVVTNDPVVVPVVVAKPDPVSEPQPTEVVDVVVEQPVVKSVSEPERVVVETPVEEPTREEAPVVVEESGVVEPEPISEPEVIVDPAPVENPDPVIADPDPVVSPFIAPVDPRTTSNESGDGPERVDAVEFEAGATLSIAGGRTTTIEIDSAKEIKSIELTSDPKFGHASVNPDNTIAMVLSGSDYDGKMSLDYRVNYADGSSETDTLDLAIQPITQDAGWGMGEHYMLETDNDGDVVVETGENHTKVYISGGEDALSRADIAVLEGISVNDVDTKWLLQNADYGANEDMALDADVGMDLWYGLTHEDQEPSSHWLLFEAGYEYGDLGKVIGRGAEGESELHPLHVTSYGDGPAPVLSGGISISQAPSDNVVISNLNVTGGLGVKDSSNILVTDTEFSEYIVNIRGSEDVTLHDSSISYTTVQTADGSGVTQGLLGVDTDGILLDGNVFHHNGWEDGYNPEDGTDGAPDMFSHNIYLQWDTTDVTYTNNISSQGASFGTQLRGGAFAEDNLFLDNNVAVNFLGGNYKEFGNVGNFTYFADNVVTSGSFKDAAGIGGKGWGAMNGGAETTMHDNIVAHLGDPDDPNGLEDKIITRFATTQTDGGDTFFDDTKVLNWLASDPDRYKDEALDRNLEGVDIDKAMETTIQRYAAELTSGQTATIDGLMDYILTLADTDYDDTVTASDIVDYFQSGFGLELDSTTGDKSHTFVPNDLAAGVRWDNSINWDSAELPSDGDQVDLNGNWVQYGIKTTRVDDLDLGDGGKLVVTSGLLGVEGDLETGGGDALVTIDGAGQFWTNGYDASGELAVDIDGGRFFNTGDINGDVTMEVEDNGQAILATDGGLMTLTNGSELRLTGSDADVGFDGDKSGTAILQMDNSSTLSFVADAEGFSSLQEFRSGVWDQDGSPVKSGVSLDGALKIDLTDYKGGDATHELISVDALHGVFDDIHVHGLGNGLEANVVIDFNTDMVSLEIASGNAMAGVDIIGDAGSRGDEAQNLWADLTAGQGVLDETPPEVIEKTLELDELF